MKKIIIAVFVLGSIINAEAQNQVQDFNAVAIEETRQWQEVLQLNEAQFMTIKKLNSERQQKLISAREQFRYNLASRDSVVAIIESYYDNMFSGIMSAKQFSGYMEFQGRTLDPAVKPVKSNMAETEFSEETNTNSEKLAGKPVFTDAKGQDVVSEADTNQLSQVMPQEGKGKKNKPTGDAKMKTGNKTLKLETEEGEIKIMEDEEKVKTKDGTKYKAETETGETKTKTPERVTKWKDGRESMKPRRKD